MAAPKGPRPGGRNHPRTPQNIAKFIAQGVEASATGSAGNPSNRAPSPSELTEEVMPDNRNLAPAITEQAPVISPLPEPVPVYKAPKQDPWEILKRSLPAEALAALEEVTGKAKEPAPGNAPWFRCYDTREGRPSGHPDFQAIVKPGQHVYCPVCSEHTVMPLENYVPQTAQTV
jgi:hypothetical protein